MQQILGTSMWIVGFVASHLWLWPFPWWAAAAGLVIGIAWAAMLVKRPIPSQPDPIASAYQSRPMSLSATRAAVAAVLALALIAGAAALSALPIYMRGGVIFLMASLTSFIAVFSIFVRKP